MMLASTHNVCVYVYNVCVCIQPGRWGYFILLVAFASLDVLDWVIAYVHISDKCSEMGVLVCV